MATEQRQRGVQSRRRAIQLLLALGGIGALGFAFVRARSKVGTSRNPRLRIRESTALEGSSGESPALWLALAAISPAKRSSVLDEIEAAMASAEARVNPLLVDLVEDDVVEVFRRNQRWLLPLCTAASALLASSYEGPDGFRVTALASNAPGEPGDISAWRGSSESARERRARFLAWPVSRSRIVRSRSKAGARRLETALRDASAQPESAMALVLDRRLLHGMSPEPRLEAVLARLTKAQGRIQGEDDLPLVPKAPAPGAPVLAWATLEDDELLVVPKLNAVSPPRRFESEIQQHLHGSDTDLIATDGD